MYKFGNSKCGCIWLMLPPSAYQCCKKKKKMEEAAQNPENPVTINCSQHISLRYLRISWETNSLEIIDRSLSATEVDKCLQALARNIQITSKYMSAPMGILKIFHSCERSNKINISLKSSLENFIRIAN